MLSGITVSCFLMSYLVVLAIEASRIVLKKAPGRNLLLIGMLIAGLAAHTIFLFNEVTVSTDQGPKLLANWFQWTVFAAWGLAWACLFLTFKNPNSSFGLFLIPTILGLIGVGQLVRDGASFSVETTINVWRIIHGVSQLVGTMFICFGATFGIMYLVHSNRLKRKNRGRSRFRLPTLEFTQSMNRLSLYVSTCALAAGLISGIILSFNRDGQIVWLSSGNIFTVVLFAWVTIATIYEVFTDGSLGGRRSAYLVIANFIMLIVVLGVVLVSAHGQPANSQESGQTSQTRGQAANSVQLVQRMDQAKSRREVTS